MRLGRSARNQGLNSCGIFEIDEAAVHMIEPSVWQAKSEIEKTKLSEKSIREVVNDAVAGVYTVHDALKVFRLELAWAGESTGGKFEFVPLSVNADADAAKKFSPVGTVRSNRVDAPAAAKSRDGRERGDSRFFLFGYCEA